MIFVVSGELHDKVYQSAKLVDSFFNNGLHVILGKDKFTYTEDSPEIVFNKLASFAHSDVVITVYPWKPWNRWTSAIATTFKNKPNEIYINVRKIEQRSVRDYVATITHETIHAAGYGHGSNSNQGSVEKLNSVPIWVAGKAAEYFY